MGDVSKVKRGLAFKESVQKIVEAMRIHYNYCREHSQLVKTPAEQAGIRIGLENNKIESLMRVAASRTKNGNLPLS